LPESVVVVSTESHCILAVGSSADDDFGAVSGDGHGFEDGPQRVCGIAAGVGVVSAGTDNKWLEPAAARPFNALLTAVRILPSLLALLDKDAALSVFARSMSRPTAGMSNSQA